MQVEIILNNGWMGKIGFSEITGMIPGRLEPKIIEDKNIFDLYSKGRVNVCFEFHGKGYCSMEPICLSRRPIAVSRELIKISKGIRNLHEEDGEYKGFQFNEAFCAKRHFPYSILCFRYGYTNGSEKMPSSRL